MKNSPVIVKEAPQTASRPILFESPHSGHILPADFSTKVSAHDLDTAWDAFVDELWTGATNVGATLIAANFPRTYIDPNRAADDIDPVLLDEAVGHSFNPTAYSDRGMGLIRRFALPGKPLYDAPLTMAQVEHRISHYYTPYHQAVGDCLEGFVTHFGQAWHLDCHSMKSVGNAMNIDEGAARADVVLGDLRGKSCDPAFTDLVRSAFDDLGYGVAVNQPYIGGFLVANYGDPASGRHSLQVELNRGLYMDESRFRKNANFSKLQSDLDIVMQRIADFVDARL